GLVPARASNGRGRAWTRAATRAAPTISGACPPLHVEAEMEDVAVLDDVLRAFEAHPAGVLGALLAVIGDEVGVGDGLGADEAFLEVGVDDARRLRRLGAAADRPGARLLRSDREIGDEVEELVAGADDAGEPGLVEPERLEELGLLRFV